MRFWVLIWETVLEARKDYVEMLVFSGDEAIMGCGILVASFLLWEHQREIGVVEMFFKRKEGKVKEKRRKEEKKALVFSL